MPRRLFFVFFAVASIAATCVCSPVWAAPNVLIPETTAAQHGLARPWFAQVELDQARAGLRHVLLYEGVLYSQTKSGTVHAIDAETGKTLWSKQVGQPDNPTMPPDARGDLLALINGSRLYVLNRFNGNLLLEKDTQDAPGSGPGLSSRRAYVPNVTGMLMAYRIDQTDAKKTGDKTLTPAAAAARTEEARRSDVRVNQKYAPTLFCQSFGRALVQPLVTRDDPGGEYVVWPTDRGYLNFGRIDRESENSFVLKYRLETGEAIVTRPAYLPPDPKVLGDAGVVFAASVDGFLYAIQEETGGTLWRFSTGEPIVESPAAIDGRVYITTQLGGMYCLDAKTGKNLWFAKDIERFIAVGKSRVYVIDAMSRLVALNAATGARLDAIPIDSATTVLSNSDTDRIYLVSEGGLIQCLREIEQTKPIQHNKERKDAAKAGQKPPEESKTEVEKPVKKEHPATKAPSMPREKPRPTKKTVKKAAGNDDGVFGADLQGDDDDANGNKKLNKKRAKIKKAEPAPF